MREQSGTCNVCAVPCSSCMHFNRAVSHMDVKSEDECSDGTSRGKEASRCSFNVTDVLPLSKNIPLQKRQCAAASETSNVFNACSSHDSFSENAESKATEDIEMHPKFPSSGTLECHGDNISCVSGVNDAGPPVTDHPNSKMKWKNVPSSSASVSCPRPEVSEKDNLVILVPGSVNGIKCEVEENFGKFRKPSMHTKEVIHKSPTSSKQEVHLQEIRSLSSHSRSGKWAPCNLDNKDSRGSYSSQGQADPSEFSELLLPNVSTTNSASTDKQTTGNCVEKLAKYEHNKTSCVENVSPGQEAVIDVDFGDSPSESMKYSDLNEKAEKPVLLPKSSGVQNSSLQVQSQLVDESDGSEIEEDVKVCDICGDAGREDLLAVCSRCGDGAEHTYCMRQMVDKVPEGDWLCEECKFKEDAEKQKRDKPEAVVEPTKLSCIYEKESMPNPKLLTKSDLKASDAESNLSPTIGSNVNISSKRHLDNVEGVSAVKRQDFESSSGSPKPSSSNKEVAVSGGGPFKNTYMGRSKMVQRIDSPTSGSNPLQTQSGQPSLSKGTFSKSDSFTEPKGKSAQEHSTSKFKMARETGEPKTTSRSSSFDQRSYSTYSIPREETSRPSIKDDLRGPKATKDRIPFERKNSFRSDRPQVTSPKPGSGGGATPKVEKIAYQGESTSGSFPAINGRSLKGNQASFKLSKLAPLSVIRDSRKPLGGSGDLKRQSPGFPRGITASPKGTMNLSDRKSSKVSLMDEPAGDGSTHCHKCKEIGHSAQFCSLNYHVSVVGGPGARFSSDAMNKRTKLKGVDEVGSSKISGEHKKSGTPDQLDDLTICNNVRREVVSNDQTSISSSCLKGLTSDKIVHDGQESFKGLASSVVYLLGILSIPQYDYIWQGGFEVQKSERVVELFDGIQAHLSTGSSPKVPEVVSKFPYKVLFEEVPRSTAWLAQFQDQATEDNIGLYFFAKDIESYERNYKRLLENMIKEDLALKGNFDGIELLIFPSNQLHERSQRWNTFFYMWGVFKGRRVDESARPQKESCGNSAHLAGGLPYPAVVDPQREGLSGNVKGLSASFPSLSTQETIRSSGLPYPVVVDPQREGLSGNVKGLSASCPSLSTQETIRSSGLPYPVVVDPQREGLSGIVKGLSASSASLSTQEAIRSSGLPYPAVVDSQMEGLSGNVKGLSASSALLSTQEAIRSSGLSYPAVVDSQREGLLGNVKGLSAYSASLRTQEAIRSSGSMGLPFPLSSGGVVKSCHKEVAYVGNEVSKSHVQAPEERKGRSMFMDDNRDNVEISEMKLDSCPVLAGHNRDLQSGNYRAQVDLNKLDCTEASMPSTSSGWKAISSGPNPVSSTSLAQDSNLIHNAVEMKMKDMSNRDEVIPVENIKDKDVMVVDPRAAFTGNLLKQEDENSSVLQSSRKRHYREASDILFQGSDGTPSSTSHSMPLNAKVEANECKKPKTSYGCIGGSSSSVGKIYLGGSFPMEDRGYDAEENMVAGETMKSERFVFPVDLNCSSDWPEDRDCTPLQVISSDDEDQPDNHFPNLELGLGGEKKPTLKQCGLQFFARLDGKKDQSKHSEDTIKKSGSFDAALGSLSLSLAFPLSSVKKEQTSANSSLNHVSIPGHLLPERRSPPNIDKSVLDLAL